MSFFSRIYRRRSPIKNIKTNPLESQNTERDNRYQDFYQNEVRGKTKLQDISPVILSAYTTHGLKIECASDIVARYLMGKLLSHPFLLDNGEPALTIYWGPSGSNTFYIASSNDTRPKQKNVQSTTAEISNKVINPKLANATAKLSETELNQLKKLKESNYDEWLQSIRKHLTPYGTYESNSEEVAIAFPSSEAKQAFKKLFSLGSVDQETFRLLGSTEDTIEYENGPNAVYFNNTLFKYEKADVENENSQSKAHFNRIKKSLTINELRPAAISSSKTEKTETFQCNDTVMIKETMEMLAQGANVYVAHKEGQMAASNDRAFYRANSKDGYAHLSFKWVKDGKTDKLLVSYTFDYDRNFEQFQHFGSVLLTFDTRKKQISAEPIGKANDTFNVKTLIDTLAELAKPLNDKARTVIYKPGANQGGLSEKENALSKDNYERLFDDVIANETEIKLNEILKNNDRLHPKTIDLDFEIQNIEHLIVQDHKEGLTDERWQAMQGALQNIEENMKKLKGLLNESNPRTEQIKSSKKLILEEIAKAAEIAPTWKKNAWECIKTKIDNMVNFVLKKLDSESRVQLSKFTAAKVRTSSVQGLVKDRIIFEDENPENSKGNNKKPTI